MVSTLTMNLSGDHGWHGHVHYGQTHLWELMELNYVSKLYFVPLDQAMPTIPEWIWGPA